MSSSPHVSRLFHAVVWMGCALGGTVGCGASKGDPAATDASTGDGCRVPDGGWPDGGSHDNTGCEDDAGWPPTK